MVSMVSFLLVFDLIIKKKKFFKKLLLNCSKIVDLQDWIFTGKLKQLRS